MRAAAALLLLAAVVRADDAEAEGDTMSINDVVDGLKGQIFADHKKGAPETFREECAAFVAAVDWREPWIRCLMGFHASMWLAFVVMRRSFPVQCCLFFGLAAIVGLAERLNALCATHWAKFSTQNYFDDRGVFAGLMLCAPLLVLAFAMLMNFLTLATTMMVTVKRAEFRGKARERGAEAEAAEAAGAKTDRNERTYRRTNRNKSK